MWDDLSTARSAPSCSSTPAASTTASRRSTTSRARTARSSSRVNRFDGVQPYALEEVRAALDVDRTTPVIECDAREKESVKLVVLTLLDVVLQRAMARSGR